MRESNPTNMRSDEQLMSDVAQGDMAAFEQLVRRHQVSVWNTAFRFLRNADDAEDIAQETFLRVLRAAGRYRPTATFRTYLYRIVTRLCRDWRAKDGPVLMSGPGQRNHAHPFTSR